MPTYRVIVAITGASGAVYGLRALQYLKALSDVEVHLIVSHAGWLNIHHELNLSKEAIRQHTDHLYSIHEIGAKIASGSFPIHGMIVAPCSMKTLASIAHGFADNLISRAADVTLKERRRLVLMVRETPLHLVHLRNMTTVTEMGGIIFPPTPAFYQHPNSIGAIVQDNVLRALDLLHVGVPQTHTWQGMKNEIKSTD